MDESSGESGDLQIRCPSCGQRFTVGAELKGRTVECGACETRFRVNDEVQIRNRKFYPGERAHPSLEQFPRVPLTGAAPQAQKFQPVQYMDAPEVAAFEPVPPQKLLAGALGVGLLILIAMLLVLGAQRGGMLDGVSVGNRLVLAAFASVVGGAMIVYANPRNRRKGWISAVGLGAAVCALPFLFRDGADPLPGREAPPPEIVEFDSVLRPGIDEEDDVAVLRARMGLGPLEQERVRVRDLGSDERVYGFWLKGLRDSERFVVRDYMIRVGGAAPSTHLYPRGDGNYLMVVPGLPPEMELEELAEISARLGTVDAFHPEIGVVEVKIDAARLEEPDEATLARAGTPEFYEINLAELASIIPTRVERAARRLADSEPRVLRADIGRALVRQLEEGRDEGLADTARAVLVWLEDDWQEASELALARLASLSERGIDVPRPLAELVIRGRPEGAAAPFTDLWRREHSLWESSMIALGPVVESRVIEALGDGRGPLRYSAARILRRVGGEASLACFEELAAVPDPQLQVLMSDGAAAIRRRLDGE